MIAKPLGATFARPLGWRKLETLAGALIFAVDNATSLNLLFSASPASHGVTVTERPVARPPQGWGPWANRQVLRKRDSGLRVVFCPKCKAGVLSIQSVKMSAFGSTVNGQIFLRSVRV
jgi:hypothetical protein